MSFLAGCGKTLSTISLARFLAGKGGSFVLERLPHPSVEGPAKGQGPSALPFVCVACSGFTFVETIIGVGIATLVATLVVSGSYQALSAEEFRQDKVLSVARARLAQGWFAGDALNAEVTDLVDGGPPATSTTLSWDDNDGSPHTVSYTATGDRLIRVMDGVTMTAGRGVASAEFSLEGKLLTMVVSVLEEQGGERSWSMQTFLRSLK